MIFPIVCVLGIVVGLRDGPYYGRTEIINSAATTDPAGSFFGGNTTTRRGDFSAGV